MPIEGKGKIKKLEKPAPGGRENEKAALRRGRMVDRPDPVARKPPETSEKEEKGGPKPTL